jgi:SAM-dependent methyltransferase
MSNPQFDTFAADYDAALNQGLSVSGEDKNYFARGRIRWTAQRLRKLGIQPAIIHDFGCGTGSATPFLYECFPGLKHVIGTDVSERSLDVAMRLFGDRASFQLMSQFRPDASADLCYCNGVFHHIPLDQRAAATKYVHDSLRPGGIFALWENNPWSPAARYVMSRIPFDKDAIMLWPGQTRRLLRSAGFEVLATSYQFIFPKMLKWLRPVERLLTRVPTGTQYVVVGRKAQD